MTNLKEIQDFIENISKTDIQKLKIKTNDFDLSIQLKPEVKVSGVPQNLLPAHNYQIPQTDSISTEKLTKEPQQPQNTNDNLKTIKAPMIGTFYRKPSPDKPVFVEVGQKINKGDVICIIEAMKLFNEIEAEFSGEVVEILVEDATPIEFDQPLFVVKV